MNLFNIFKPQNKEITDTRMKRLSELTAKNKEQGSSGTEIYSGYYSEDYLTDLQGNPAADIYDKMRRGNPQIKMVLSAILNTIKSGVWSFEPVDDSDEEKRRAELMTEIFFQRMDRSWEQFVTESLSMVTFGYALFEPIHRIVLDDEEFGSFVGVKKIAFRSPRTIEQWLLNENGDLKQVTQIAQGDLGKNSTMDARDLMHFAIDQEGDNYEGISCLRPCFGPWSRQNSLLKLDMIGAEKLAFGQIKGTYPDGMQGSPAFNKFIAILQNYMTHQKGYIALPRSEDSVWDVEITPSGYDSSKLAPSIEREDKWIVKSFLANFLELGISSSSGSWSLSADQSDFFLGGIEYIKNTIVNGFNRQLGSKICRMNFGPAKKYPKLKCTGISDKAGTEYALILKTLRDGGILTPDEQIEVDTRKRYGLPEMTDETLEKRRSTPTDPSDPSDPVDDKKAKKKDKSDKNEVDKKDIEDVEDEKKTKDEENLSERRRFLLAEKSAKSQIEESKKKIKKVMQDELILISDDFITRIMKEYNKATPSQKVKLIKNISTKGKSRYKKSLMSAFAETANLAIAKARKEVPKAADVKLSDAEQKEISNALWGRLGVKADLITESTMSDMEKNIKFQYDSSQDSTDSAAIIKKDLTDTSDKYIGSSSVDAAAGNEAARTVNAARQSFFFAKDVLDQIETFTFMNSSPVSPICQDLNGKTFGKDDPEAERYFPPLHFNCKSYLIPNLNGSNKEAGLLRPSDEKLEKYIQI